MKQKKVTYRNSVYRGQTTLPKPFRDANQPLSFVTIVHDQRRNVLTITPAIEEDEENE